MTTQQPIVPHNSKVQLTDDERRMVERFDDDVQPRRDAAKQCSGKCRATKKRRSPIVPGVPFLVY